MRVLLSTSGLRGDVEPMVALATRLRALGVQVRMCAPPDAADRFAGLDVEVVPVGQSLRAMMRAITGSSRGNGLRLPAEEIDEQFDQVPAAAEGCDAVVATGVLSAAIGVRSVAEKLGIPYFYAAYCPIYLPSPHFPPPLGRGDGEPPEDLDINDNRALWEFYNQVYFDRYGGPLNRRRAEIGLPPVEKLIDYGCTDRPWLAADPLLAPLKPDQDVVQTGAWILPDERPLSPELEAFLADGEPPVFVGFGSTSDTDVTAKLAVEAIRAQGRRVVLSRGWAELALPDDRADCFAVGETNFQALFGRVAAVVHHGGGGTTTVAARAGVPQVAIPQMTDQPYFADQVAALGIGVAFEEYGPAPTFESLSAALATALSPETRERAAAVAAEIRSDGTTVAAGLLRDAVGRSEKGNSNMSGNITQANEPVLVEVTEDFTCYAGPDPSGQHDELMFIFNEVFHFDTYAQSVGAVPENGVILDVGANVGLFSIYAKRQKPNVRLIAFEPIPASAAALRRNVELHGMSGLTIHQLALGEADRKDVAFTYYPGMPGNSTRHPETKNEHFAAQAVEVGVEVATLSSVLAKHPELDRVDLVKVDVEGSELEVLAGLTEDDWAKIRSWVIEISDAKGELAELRKELESRGYTVEAELDDKIMVEPMYLVHASRK